jgi:alkylation response protein AidB-like acyl-CoA dehydrogenase
VSPTGERPSREAVLDAFAVESAPDGSTLERYLQLYPELAAELVDLSRELGRERHDETGPLTADDSKLLDAAWARHAAALPTAAAEPFAKLTADDWRAVARRLDVPRQVVTALREHRVLLASIPKRFLQMFADAAGSTIALVETSWASPESSLARSYKADSKPAINEQVTLEQVLVEAGVPAEKRARLLAEAD